jgi:hypothetical protein
VPEEEESLDDSGITAGWAAGAGAPAGCQTPALHVQPGPGALPAHETVVDEPVDDSDGIVVVVDVVVVVVVAAELPVGDAAPVDSADWSVGICHRPF